MYEEKDDPHEKADDSDNYVRNPKERVPAPQQAGGGQYHTFSSLELSNLDTVELSSIHPFINRLILLFINYTKMIHREESWFRGRK